MTENRKSKTRTETPVSSFRAEVLAGDVHRDWFHNIREERVLALEDNASRKVLGMIETDAQSAERSVELYDEVRWEHETDVPIIEVVTDHGSEFVNTRRDDRPDHEHAFEGYLAKNDIMHMLRKVGRPQSNGKIERIYQTYEKKRWRFDGLDEFLEFSNEADRT